MSFLILLPPSEGKLATPGEGASFSEACPCEAAEVKHVVRHLRALPAAERASWYGVSTPAKAAEAHRMNLAALSAPGLPAIERYTGVVFTHLDYPSLRQKKRALDSIYIVSGYFGFIPAGASIANYKLPMNAWLARHWRPINATRMERWRSGRKVLSLLPTAHAKALGVEPDLSIDFRLEGGRKSAGHFGKAIKGKFARFLIEQRVKDLDGVAAFAEDGFQFDGENFVQR